MIAWLKFGRLRPAVAAVSASAALTASLAVLSGPAGAQQTLDTSRIVTLGGSVTEIVYALGAGARIVGTDQSSIYPPQATELPSVGYYRRLPSEGVVSLRPTVILASEHAGPPDAIAQMKSLGIPVIMVSDKPNLDSLQSRIERISESLQVQAQGDALIRDLRSSLAAVQAKSAPPLSAMTVVMRGGKLLGAGSDTAANVVLEAAGLKNVLKGQNAYRPLSAEVVSALAPEVLVVTTSTVESMGGLDQVRQSPVLAMTPAVKHNKVIVLDDLLAQGFGLRFAQAIAQVRDGVLGVAN